MARAQLNNNKIILAWKFSTILHNRLRVYIMAIEGLLTITCIHDQVELRSYKSSRDCGNMMVEYITNKKKPLNKATPSHTLVSDHPTRM